MTGNEMIITDELYKQLIDESVKIKSFIYQNGGNACKSYVEDVLMNYHPGLTRYTAHDIQNHIEFYNIGGYYRTPVSIDEVREYFAGVEGNNFGWFRGNPFEMAQA